MSGRILIDIYGYHKHNGGLKRKENQEQKQLTEDPYQAVAGHVPLGIQMTPAAPTGEPPAENSAYIKRLTDEEQQKNKDEMLARGQDLIFLSPILAGFSLKDKLWC